jgi:hypothetical protein
MDNPTHAPGSPASRADAASEPATARADLIIRRTSSATVCFLAAVAGVVSYGHMHALALRYGEQPWTAALLPLSVDGMIIAASLALLSDSRRGRRGGVLPWALLVIASGASLAANVAVAHPMLISRIISAWPPFALIGAYEMLMRQIRQSVAGRQHAEPAAAMPGQHGDLPAPDGGAGPAAGVAPSARQFSVAAGGKARQGAGRLQRQAWQWALTHRLPGGELPTGEAIAGAFQRSARWGRLVKSAGLNGQYDHDAGQRAA